MHKAGVAALADGLEKLLEEGADFERVELERIAYVRDLLRGSEFTGGTGADSARVVVPKMPPPGMLFCALCIAERAQAELRGTPIPEVLPAMTVMQGMSLCQITHTIGVQSPLLAP
jgi:hypothetical protein